jgi:hypothetical protein
MYYLLNKVQRWILWGTRGQTLTSRYWVNDMWHKNDLKYRVRVYYPMIVFLNGLMMSEVPCSWDKTGNRYCVVVPPDLWDARWSRKLSLQTL